jgi:hypothetical protein
MHVGIVQANISMSIFYTRSSDRAVWSRRFLSVEEFHVFRVASLRLAGSVLSGVDKAQGVSPMIAPYRSTMIRVKRPARS